MKRWTDFEINIIKKNHDKLLSREISKLINRTQCAIKQKRKKLGLKPFKFIKSFPKSKQKITANVAYITGVILGDGTLLCKSIPKHNGYIKMTVKDKEFALEFKNNIERWLNKKASLYKYYRRGTFGSRYMWTVQYCSYLVARYIKEIVNNLEQFLTLSNEIKYALLKGLYDSEGCIHINKKNQGVLIFSNSNFNLIKFVKQLMESVGFKKLKIYKHNKREMYNLTIYSIKNIISFYDKIGFTIFRKQNRLNSFANSKRRYYA